ncbi:MAG: MBL fold metallo-hydrolase, partial [Candidatus Helarchaeota archaeon]
TKFKYLFDTGASSKGIINNIEALKVNLKDLDAIILSHGHYDHTGGLISILEKDFLKKIDLVCHPNALKPKFSRLKNSLRDIGMPFNPKILENNDKINLITEKDPHFFSKSIFTTGEIERNNEFEKVPERFRTILDEEEVKDEILDDQALVFILGSGALILGGCSHSGVINTINKVITLSGSKNITALFGGFHLISANFDVIQKTMVELKKFNIEMIGPCHCTGQYASNLIMTDFLDNFQPVSTGTSFYFG